jgi:hypothetical protein
MTHLRKGLRSTHSENNSDPENFPDPCSTDVSGWWAVLGSNQWPLPCETEVGCLQINDMRGELLIATRTCCHLVSLGITQCHDPVVPKLSQRHPDARSPTASAAFPVASERTLLVAGGLVVVSTTGSPAESEHLD